MKNFNKRKKDGMVAVSDISVSDHSHFLSDAHKDKRAE
jgi:hypothetical protein